MMKLEAIQLLHICITDLGFLLESMESATCSTCIKKLNMATPLRCFAILGQSVPWKCPTSKNGIGGS